MTSTPSADAAITRQASVCFHDLHANGDIGMANARNKTLKNLLCQNMTDSSLFMWLDTTACPQAKPESGQAISAAATFPDLESRKIC